MSKTITGIVTSTASDKTIVITEHVRKTHPLYKKQYTVTSKFMAHDEKNECRVGDKVVIEETKPISARKYYRLKEILERATLTEKDQEMIKGDETKEVASSKKQEAGKAAKEEDKK